MINKYVKMFNVLDQAKKVERRKRVRDHLDFVFEAHRDICTLCSGKSYFEIKSFDHSCDEGFKLAINASKAHRAISKPTGEDQ
jgi:hypothetical protein